MTVIAYPPTRPQLRERLARGFCVARGLDPDRRLGARAVWEDFARLADEALDAMDRMTLEVVPMECRWSRSQVEERGRKTV